MMVLRDRILFMFSEENKDNLWKKPSFVIIFLFMIILLFLLIWDFILYVIFYIIEILLFKALENPDILPLIDIVWYGICIFTMIFITIRFYP